MQSSTANAERVGEAHTLWRAAVAADLERCEGILPNRLLSVARAHIEQRESNSPVASPLAVLSHGDFWPGNVFVSADGAEVIDFEGARFGLPYEDVGYFTVQLELFFAHPLYGRRAPQAVTAFLAGYLGSDNVDESAYRLARISKTLQVAGRAKRGQMTPAARWRLVKLRALLEREFE